MVTFISDKLWPGRLKCSPVAWSSFWLFTYPLCFFGLSNILLQASITRDAVNKVFRLTVYCTLYLMYIITGRGLDSLALLNIWTIIAIIRAPFHSQGFPFRSAVGWWYSSSDKLFFLCWVVSCRLSLVVEGMLLLGRGLLSSPSSVFVEFLKGMEVQGGILQTEQVFF